MSMPMDGRVQLSAVADKPLIVHRPPNVPEVPRWAWARETFVPANSAAYAITFAGPRSGTELSLVSDARTRQHRPKTTAGTDRKPKRVGRTPTEQRGSGRLQSR